MRFTRPLGFGGKVSPHKLCRQCFKTSSEPRIKSRTELRAEPCTEESCNISDWSSDTWDTICAMTSDHAHKTSLRDRCHRIVPSQPAAPPTPHIEPEYPFQCMSADFFKHKGQHYLIIVDQYSQLAHHQADQSRVWPHQKLS